MGFGVLDTWGLSLESNMEIVVVSCPFQRHLCRCLPIGEVRHSMVLVPAFCSVIKD